VVALIAGLVALIGPWGRRLPEDRPPAAGVTSPQGPPIKVGVLHSRTGTMAISERSVIDATLLAVDEINEKGGVLGRPVEAVVEDGESDSATFAAKAEKLITSDRVCTVFGCWTSASRKTVLPLFERHDHLLVYPVQYEGLEQSPNIVYTGAAPNQQIIPAVRWCVSSQKKKRIFLVGSDYVFPRTANAIIRDQAKDLGAEIVGEQYVPLGSSAVDDVVRKIVATQPEAILNSINGDSNVPFFRALRAAGITPDRIPTISFSISEEELSSLSMKDVVGDYAAWNYFQTVDRPQNRDFVRRFHARYGKGRVISDPMEAAYFGVGLWAQAVNEAGEDGARAIRKAIRHQSIDAPSGLVRLDPETQHASKVFRIGRITKDSRFEVVFSSDSPLAPMPYPNTRSKGEWDAFLLDLNLRWGGRWANPGK
jgi:urea transport system substrate-binding protein